MFYVLGLRYRCKNIDCSALNELPILKHEIIALQAEHILN